MRHDKTITITLRVTGDDSRDEHDTVAHALAFIALKHKGERPLLELKKAHNFTQPGRFGVNVIGTIDTKDNKQ